MFNLRLNQAQDDGPKRALTIPTSDETASDKPRSESPRVASVEGHRRRLDLEMRDSSTGTAYEIRQNGDLRASTNPLPWVAAVVEALNLERSYKPRLDILLRGLGCGEVLRGLLQAKAVRSVTVLEPDRAIVTWNRRYLENQALLDDARTEVVVGPFAEYLQGVPRSYDGIALDYSASLLDGALELTLTLAGRLRTRLRSSGSLTILTPVPEGDNGAGSCDHVLSEVFEAVDRRVVEAADSDGTTYQSHLYTL